MPAAHLLVAAESGMKAGFRQFAAQSSKSGLEPVQQLWSRFESRNAKGKFDLYCAIYGPLVADLGGNTPKAKAATVNAPISEGGNMDAIQAIAERLAAIEAKLDGNTDTTPEPKAPRSTKKATPKAKKSVAKGDSTFSTKVCSAMGIPTVVGDEFTYYSKRGTETNWVVTKSSKTGITASRI